MKRVKIISAGNKEVFNFAEAVGVGMINCAINLTRICLFDKPDFLIFIGTGGSYGRKKLFDFIETKTSSNIENCFVYKKCYTPADNLITFSKDVSRETIVNSSNYITTDPETAKKYLKLNIDIENMEFYSVMKVAKEFEIPVIGMFVVTNYCNENAHKDYLKNINKAKKILIENLVKKRIIKEKYE